MTTSEKLRALEAQTPAWDRIAAKENKRLQEQLEAALVASEGGRIGIEALVRQRDDLQEQLEASQRENMQLGDELGSVGLQVEKMGGEIRRALASIALEMYAGSRSKTAEILRAALNPAKEPSDA